MKRIGELDNEDLMELLEPTIKELGLDDFNFDVSEFIMLMQTPINGDSMANSKNFRKLIRVYRFIRFCEMGLSKNEAFRKTYFDPKDNTYIDENGVKQINFDYHRIDRKVATLTNSKFYKSLLETMKIPLSMHYYFKKRKVLDEAYDMAMSGDMTHRNKIEYMNTFLKYTTEMTPQIAVNDNSKVTVNVASIKLAKKQEAQLTDIKKLSAQMLKNADSGDDILDVINIG